jgi:DNA-binding response OmpR family regulator
MAERIAIVEDEQNIRDNVAFAFEREGYRVSTFADGKEAWEVFQHDLPELLILDIIMPRMDGLELCRRVRGLSETVPIIFLTSRDEEFDRVLGLELGADDYVVKPFSPRELVARVRSVLRRVNPSVPSSTLEFEGLAIDIGSRQVHVRDEEVELTAREFDLLAYMASHPKQVFSRAQLLEQVWDSSPEWQDPATVTVHVRRVRHKIEDDPTDPRWLQTAWGVGYKFQP